MDTLALAHVAFQIQKSQIKSKFPEAMQRVFSGKTTMWTVLRLSGNAYEVLVKQGDSIYLMDEIKYFKTFEEAVQYAPVRWTGLNRHVLSICKFNLPSNDLEWLESDSYLEVGSDNLLEVYVWQPSAPPVFIWKKGDNYVPGVNFYGVSDENSL